MVSEAPTSKILYQLVSPLHRLVGESEIKRREGFLKRWASPAVDIHAASPESGPTSWSCLLTAQWCSRT